MLATSAANIPTAKYLLPEGTVMSTFPTPGACRLGGVESTWLVTTTSVMSAAFAPRLFMVTVVAASAPILMRYSKAGRRRAGWMYDGATNSANLTEIGVRTVWPLELLKMTCGQTWFEKKSALQVEAK